MKAHVDTIEQKQKEARVRICGMQEENGENLHKKVLKMAKSQLGLKKLKEGDIQEAYRAGKKKEHRVRDVVIQFTTKCTRDSFLQQKIKLPRTPDPKTRIYINEDLTEL